MNVFLPGKLTEFSRTATLYVVVAGIALTILVPIFSLVSLSLMCDREAYQWPLPLVPARTADFLIKKTETSCLVSIYSGVTHSYEPFIESDDPDEIRQFMKRQANCVISTAALRAKLDKLDHTTTAQLSVRRTLLANYHTFFRVTRDALPAFYRSIITALATILISLTIGGSAGYAFARYTFTGKHLLRAGVLFVRIFPAIAIAIPMVIILANMGLYDKPLGLALVYSVSQISLAVWITASVFMGIPVELEEAACVFGCTRYGAFMRVTLPLALPGLAACAMYAFIGSWNETVQALVLTQVNPTFPVVVYQTLVGSEGMANLAAAGGVTMALPAVVFTLIIRKYILKMWGGLTV